MQGLVSCRRFGVSSVMSDAPADARRPRGAMQLLVDLGPILVFVIAYNVLQRIPATKENAVYVATGLFIATVLAAVAYTKATTGRVPPVLIITGVFVTAFGGLTILLHDQTLIQIKVSAVNAFYAAAILVSVMLGQNVWKLLFGHVYTLPDRIWRILALRWAGYFLVMALLNEVLRRTLSFDAWLNTRLLVAYIPFFVFFFANAPLVMKHHVEDEAATPAKVD
jgi:intracellular septation protein